MTLQNRLQNFPARFLPSMRGKSQKALKLQGFCSDVPHAPRLQNVCSISWRSDRMP
jgi:hypothetical protein